MNKAGTFGNFGTNWDDIRAAFSTENVAMYLDSSAGVADMIANSPFEVGVAYIPYADDVDRNGVVIGGASLWMSKGIAEKEQEAAWEFMKYLTTPEIQAQWHLETGYFAINPAAYEEESVKTAWDETPQIKVTVDAASRYSTRTCNSRCADLSIPRISPANCHGARGSIIKGKTRSKHLMKQLKVQIVPLKLRIKRSDKLILDNFNKPFENHNDF